MEGTRLRGAGASCRSALGGACSWPARWLGALLLWGLGGLPDYRDFTPL